jgi:diguanylate cyclase
MATALHDALQRAIEIDGTSVTVGASVGVSVYPTDGMDVTTLLSAADQAMYRAKGREHRR